MVGVRLMGKSSRLEEMGKIVAYRHGEAVREGMAMAGYGEGEGDHGSFAKLNKGRVIRLVELG